MKYMNWLTQWLNIYVKPGVKQRTFEIYKGIVHKQLIPCLGDYELNELLPAVLQKFTAELCLRYAVNTVCGIISVLKNSLKAAQRMGMVDREYTNRIQMPKACEKEVNCFSAAEQKKIESAVFKSGKDSYFGIILCLYTGLRIGELIALQWEDVDLRKRIIAIIVAAVAVAAIVAGILIVMKKRRNGSNDRSQESPGGSSKKTRMELIDKSRAMVEA